MTAVSFSSNIDQNLSDPSTSKSIFVLLLLAAVVEASADVEVAGEVQVLSVVVGAVIVVCLVSYAQHEHTNVY